MNSVEIVGEEVVHKTYGEGKVISASEGYIKIVFEKGVETEFPFPKAFHSFLVFKDKDLQAKTSEENKNKEVNKSVSVEKLPSSSALKRLAKEIVQKGDGYSTHAEALNDCFGFNYKHFQQAYKVISDEYAVWFPNIARKAGAGYVSTDKTLGWVNVLTEKGKIIIQRDRDKKQSHNDEKFVKKRIVFAKQEGDSRYVFLGLFDEGERIDEGIRFNLVSDSFNLIDMKPVKE